MRAIVLLAVSVLCGGSEGVVAETWYVDGSGTPGVDCDCVAIEACLDSASAADTVLVACGVYYEHDIQMKSGVCLRSETGQADCVTVDAMQHGRVINCEALGAGTCIQGLTLTGGLPAGPWSETRGGGIACYSSSLLIRSCALLANSAYGGGGISCIQSSPTLTDCLVSANSATAGGGIACDESSPVVSQCAVAANSAIIGGGSACFASSMTFLCVRLEGNHASETGGGVYGDANSSLELADCLFLGNSAGLNGGGISSLWSPGPSLAGCVFSGNTATGCGGGLFCYYYSHPVVNGCTFYDNTASQGSAIFGSNSSPTLENTILAFGNGGSPVACEGYAGAAVSCCDVYGNEGGDWVGCLEGQLGIDGNFSECPLFCDPADDDYSLQECSPCAPGNHPTGYDCGLIGAFDVGCGCGLPSIVERGSWGALKAMYR